VLIKHDTIKTYGGLTYRRNFGGISGAKCAPPPMFFLPENSFLLATELKRANNKNGLGKSGERHVCVYIKNWFKIIFPFFLN
jgi:hypothetical protein